MTVDENNYYINQPVFLHYKTRFKVPQFRWERYLKSVYINERIVEIPFAIQCISQLSRDKRILDLGCTESDLSLKLAALGYSVTGFDFREYPYTHPNLQFVQGDILKKFPFADESYDAVLCVSTIEHVGIGYYEDTTSIQDADQSAIQEVGRVLKRSGTLIFTAPFGVRKTDQHHRVYDADALDRLLQAFFCEERRYFASTWNGDSRSNFWKEVGQDEAARIESGESASCVCLVRARKK